MLLGNYSMKMNEIQVSDSDVDAACAAAVYILLSGEVLKKKKKRRKRRCWMNALHKSRKSCNVSDMLSDLKQEPSGIFENFCRMSATDFEILLSRIGRFIARRNTNMRECIPIQERLAVTLRFFATGDSFAGLSYLFKFSKQTISRCVDDVCTAIIQELKEEVKLPKNEKEWLSIAQKFENKWNFPNCVGAIDGKHIVVHCPMSAITEFSYYKGAFSVILLAMVDAHYCFTFVDIGCQGQINDERILNKSSLFTKLEKCELKLPSDGQIPSSDYILPYVFLGNSAFALNRHMMKPYPGVLEKACKERIFNYRLSRAQCVAENVFGIMASVFRVFRKPITLQPDKVRNIILTCVLLHNFMRKSPSASSYSPLGTFDIEVEGEIVPGSWRNDQSGMTSFLPIKKVSRKPEEEEAKAIRNSFSEYFANNGKLSWQDTVNINV